MSLLLSANCSQQFTSWLLILSAYTLDLLPGQNLEKLVIFSLIKRHSGGRKVSF